MYPGGWCSVSIIGWKGAASLQDRYTTAVSWKSIHFSFPDPKQNMSGLIQVDRFRNYLDIFQASLRAKFIVKSQILILWLDNIYVVLHQSLALYFTRVVCLVLNNVLSVHYECFRLLSESHLIVFFFVM